MNRKALALTFISTLLISLLLVASVPSLKAAYKPPQIEWQKTYAPLSGYSLAQTNDGGYIIAGQQAAWKEGGLHTTSGWTNFTAVLIKVDGSGILQWTKTYGDEVGGGGTARSVVQTKDSGFAIIGLGPSGVFLIKTDLEGNIQWNATVAWSGGTMFCDGIKTSDGGYLIVGTSQREYPNQFGWILKTDENGNTMWNRTFGDYYTSAFAVAEADDGGYAVAGHWKNDCWFAKTDVNGNLQWNHTYDFRFNDEIWYTYTATSIAKTAGGYILGGGNNKRGFLVKTTSEGIMEWNRHYVDDSAFSSIVQAVSGDGYFAVGGFSYPSNNDVWFVKLNSSGDLLWDSTYNIPRGDSRHQNAARAVVSTSDGGYAVAGSLNGTVWLVKFAAEPAVLPDYTSPPPDETAPPFSTTVFVVAVTITVIVISFGLGLLIYLAKKRKR